MGDTGLQDYAVRADMGLLSQLLRACHTIVLAGKSMRSLPSSPSSAFPIRSAACAHGDPGASSLQDWLSLLVDRGVDVEMARQVVQPLNVVLLTWTAICVSKPLLKVKGWDGLVSSDTCTLSVPARVSASRGYQVLDLVAARELGIGVVGVEALLPWELGKLLMKAEGFVANMAGSKPFGLSRLSLTSLNRRRKLVFRFPSESSTSS